MLPSWTPDLATLDLFVSVADLGSVGKAATAHGISQPSASARLARLERQLRLPLLARGARGTGLTSHGREVHAWAVDVLAAAGALVDGVQASRQAEQDCLRVAASLTIAEYCLTPWLLTLRRRRPDVHVSVTVANSHGVCEQVRTGQVEVGLVESPEVPADLSSQVLGSDRLALVVSPDHPRAPHAADGVRAAEIASLPLLVREPGSGTREAFLAGLEAALGAPASVTSFVELGSTATIVASVRAGGGVGVVSARAVASDLEARTLVELRVTDLGVERPLTAVWVGPTPPPLAAELVALARTQLAAAARP
ncbi:MAG: LysR substrate-binding domain-containing protein [Marmoricola sp.]